MARTHRCADLPGRHEIRQQAELDYWRFHRLFVGTPSKPHSRHPHHAALNRGPCFGCRFLIRHQESVVIERINVPARTVFSAEFNKSKYSLRICYGKWLDTLRTEFHDWPRGHTPPGATKGHSFMHKAIGPRFFSSFGHAFPFSISALNDSARLAAGTPNDSARRSDISLLGSSIKRAFLFVLGHGNKKHLSASIAEA
jgi:hypothetical protein